MSHSPQPVINVPAGTAKPGEVRYAVVHMRLGWMIELNRNPEKGGPITCRWGAPMHALLFDFAEANDLATAFVATVQKVLVKELEQ